MLDLDLTSLFRGGPATPSTPTVRVLVVCTGNVCRSPLAAQVLSGRAEGLDVSIASAGTHALSERPMTPEAARLAASLGARPDDTAAHRARQVHESDLEGADLVLAMTREHRSHVVGLAPARTRSTFTVRELARLAGHVSDADLRGAADEAGADPHARLRAGLALLSAYRGEVDDPADDDVVDPYRRAWGVYEESAAQLLPGVDETARMLRVVCG